MKQINFTEQSNSPKKWIFFEGHILHLVIPVFVNFCSDIVQRYLCILYCIHLCMGLCSRILHCMCKYFVVCIYRYCIVCTYCTLFIIVCATVRARVSALVGTKIHCSPAYHQNLVPKLPKPSPEPEILLPDLHQKLPTSTAPESQKLRLNFSPENRSTSIFYLNVLSITTQKLIFQIKRKTVER